MTIFLEIAKEYLIKELTKISDTSVASDKSVGNTVCSWLGLGRDEGLSQSKRELTDILRTDIRNLASDESDEKNVEALNHLLSECRRKAREKADQKGYSEGTFGPAMSEVSTLLTQLYDRFDAAGLLDIPYNTKASERHPLTVFRYWAGVYLAYKVKENRDNSQSTLKTITHNPKITSLNLLEKQKQDAVVSYIRECDKDLKTIKEDLEDYREVCTKRVLEFLRRLLLKNKELVEHHGTNLEIPVTISFFASATVSGPALGPHSGELKKCILMAIKELGGDKEESKEELHTATTYNS
ncbi:hypothetical protein GH742_00580 [Legionella sp. MW5194]|uniref:hypothetical protein n=1 Tax=Legionella sp. MW5194 TaxID=2662448 RepID=UPI00193E2A15|nr:hypothetical protein [Legionella sp. MW5194]QRN02490.1 hypothetical protein GH742_00580 [Legionella sp. MW5194]